MKMKKRIFGAIIFLLLGVVNCGDVENIDVSQTSVLPTIKKYPSFLDVLKEDLLIQEWDDNEKSCHDQILKILTNVQNSTLWATWIWDSVQLPSGQFYGAHNHFGNFDQCLRRLWNDDPMPTQYCLVDLKLAEADKLMSEINPYDKSEGYFHFRNEYSSTFNIMSWGICMPAVCQTESIHKFVRTLYRYSHISTINPHPDIKSLHCQFTRTPQGNTTGLYSLLLSAVLLIVIASTCTFITMKNKDSKTNRIVMKIVSAFDLRKNASDLMSVSKDEIKVMHGVRFLTAFMVVTLHVMFINIMATAGNGLDMMDDFKRYAGFLSHASVVVDTYFMMSGLLLMKSFKPETGRLISPIKLIIKRYFRLIWVFIVMILVVVTATPYLYGGPLWSKYAQVEQEACEKNWWLGLLMVGNYIDPEHICMQITWYIPADYHMAVACTLMYWLYQKNKRSGLCLFGLVTIASLLLPGVYTYYHKLNAITIFDVETITNSRKDISGFPIYGLSHFRAAPYFVGLIAGYILSVYKPSNYRNVISIKYSIISFITIMALCLGVLVMGPAYKFREYNALESAVFAATNRSVWAALNAAFILLCEYGTLPLIPDFLGCSVFTPLSKLSFGIYMCHFIFVMRLTLALRSQAWHDFYKIFQDSCGIVVVSSIASLYMTLFIESPLNNLVGLVIKTKPTTSKNVEKCDTKIVKGDSFKDNAAVVAINDESPKDNRNVKANGIDNNSYTKEANEENKKKDVWRQDL
ncbi:nose resistant to fluoxetine protein 6-like [Papilio machaon]|uniref:nose resistant to fluoxetine protein 6-like n=1 Tax=Papilio machaon TaxID=76193 RepID=UPI001E666028|nr:nose resistant to fluoxetine protein 6-like [Papilio machaon]